MRFYLPHPVLECVKGCPVVDRIDHDDTHRTLVIGLCDGLESLLACGVPDLEPDFLPLDLDGFYFEINADGR